MKKDDTMAIVHELAASTNQSEKLVSRLYSEALVEFRKDAKVLDYVPLFAARRVRESLKN